MSKGKPRPQVHHTLSQEAIEYLKTFDNQSKIIDEALELHKNRNRPLPKAEILRVIR